MKTQPSDPNEEPFPLDDSQDRLWDVLGEARPPKAPSNFVHNVLCEARRSADQANETGLSRWIEAVLGKLRRPAFALSATAAAAIAIAALVTVSQTGDDQDASSNLVDGGAASVEPSPAPSVGAPDSASPRYSVSEQLDDIDLLGDLVAVTDPAVLNDQMLADLLY